MNTIPQNAEHIEAAIVSNRTAIIRLRRRIWVLNWAVFGFGILFFVSAFWFAFHGGLLAPVIGLLSYSSLLEWHRDGKNYGFLRFKPDNNRLLK